MKAQPRSNWRSVGRYPTRSKRGALLKRRPRPSKPKKKPSEPRPIRRRKASHTARNYYLIVEAVSPSGQRLKLPITSEEDGKVRALSEWGLRVEPQVYEQVRQDKMQDGIVNDKIVGFKKRGYLTPEYTVATTGGTITEW